MKRKIILIFIVISLLFSCKGNTKKDKIVETRTSGTTTLLVDESFSRILDDQIAVFKSDYPKTKFTTILGNENKILPDFLNGKIKMIILSRMLKPAEQAYYKKRQVGIYTDRFAIDGIALITNKEDADTNLTVNEVYEIMRGQSNRKLVFDNAYSSTIRYFIDSSKVSSLPKTGVYTLKTNNDVIKYVASHKGFIGVVGVNWLLEDNQAVAADLLKVKTVAIKGKLGTKSADSFYQPTQENLINGKYPFLRNVYIINCEGRDGLGTGFANWLTSQRGQLIVLKSGLGPHKLLPRELNIRTN
jgi:phosphate transport system substrate-binding protein